METKTITFPRVLMPNQYLEVFPARWLKRNAEAYGLPLERHIKRWIKVVNSQDIPPLAQAMFLASHREVPNENGVTLLGVNPNEEKEVKELIEKALPKVLPGTVQFLTAIFTCQSAGSGRWFNSDGTFRNQAQAITSMEGGLGGPAPIKAGLVAAPLSPGNLSEVQELMTFRNKHYSERNVHSVAFSPDGQYVVSGSNNDVRVWNLPNQEEWDSLHGHTNAVRFVTFSPEGQRVISASFDGTIRYWDPLPEKELTRFTRYDPFGWWSMALSPDGQSLVGGSRAGTISVLDAKTGKGLADFKAHKYAVNAVAISPDGKRVASSGSFDDMIRIWDIQTQKKLADFKGEGTVESVAFSPDSEHLASASHNTSCIWNTKTGEKTASFEWRNYSEWQSVAFSPDGRLLASGSAEGTVRIFSVETKKELASLKGHSQKITSLAFSPTGGLLASGSEDGTVRIWGKKE